MRIIQKETLIYEVAENISAPHMFTTRMGGVSKGHLAAMNIGTRRGDDPENVRKNYDILGKTIGFDPKKSVHTKQTHTDIVRVADATLWGAGLYAPELSDCDALVTNTAETTLVVFSADCTPILLHDPVTGAVGAAHAGWRGTVADIAGKTVGAMVENFGCRASDICAAIGPNIGQCCFETDKDVPEAVLSALGAEFAPYISQRGEKYYLDLKKINARLLRRAGVRCVDISAQCTACNPTLFWSHRKVGSNRGSQGAIIVCKEKVE